MTHFGSLGFLKNLSQQGWDGLGVSLFFTIPSGYLSTVGSLFFRNAGLSSLKFEE